jgi:hypothetical protein
MLAILPGQIVPSASYVDADGDTVSIAVTGTVGANAGFSVELAGLATDNADATRINLSGLTKDNGLQIVVTPNKLTPQPGGNFATLYSAGYTNVTFISNDVDPTAVSPATPMTALGGIQLSAAIVHSTKLTGVAVGTITLDPGQAPYVDRINTQNNQQATDTTMYNPVTGLIHLGGIVAASVDNLVIDGAISAKTNNPNDLTTTNDFRSVIEVAGRIGSIVGLRSNLRASVHADSIGSIRVAAISGEITTRNAAEDLAINLPSSFSGFINSAGHLHLGFPMGDASKITGQINALGISGNVKEEFRGLERFTDPLYIPGTYAGSISLSGNPEKDFHVDPVSGEVVREGNLPDVFVDGPALFGLQTNYGNIAKVSADSFAPTFLAEADAGSIGDIEASQGEFAGHLRAKNDIGDVRAPLGYLGSAVSFAGDVGNVYAAVGGFEGYIRAAGNVGDVLVFEAITGLAENQLAISAGGDIGTIESIAGGIEGLIQAEGSIGTVTAAGNILAGMLARSGSIGAITSRAGFMEAPSIQAGTDIGPLSLYAGMLGTSIVAGGDLGPIGIRVGGIELCYLRARDIGSITVVDGSIHTSSLVAGRDIGAISTFGSIAGFGLKDVSLVAARNIGFIDAKAHTGYGIELLKAEAGGDIAGISGISYGEFGSLDGAGILESNVVAANIGSVYGRGVGGTGIEVTKIITRTAYDAGGAIDRSRGRIGAVTGDGWLDGLLDVTVVAHTDIASITGVAAVDGTGIDGGSFDANYGAIGQITAAGGAAGGYGILETRFQATDLEVGRIAGITTSANANGLDAMNAAKVYAGSIGPIKATVHGGLDGNGIVGGEIRSFSGAIDSIDVTVRSINGIGILDGKITASGDMGPLTVWALNAAAISGGEFQSRGNFGDITATAEKGGNAIENAIFTAPGRIFYDDPLNPRLDRDPQGSFGRIFANANGTNKLSNGIVGTTFSAIGDIGQITVRTKGATGILDSIFEADTDGDYEPAPSPDRPGETTGTIAGISVVAAGRNLVDSSGIVSSKFTAAMIGPVTVRIQTVEGGDGIVASTFAARTAVYDGFGNFDNTGRIGAITVSNAASQLVSGAGIRQSVFTAGAAGGIGDINVTTASGSGIVGSVFDASILGVVLDPDQNLFTSTIGNIIVNSGRTLNWTFVPAGITLSSFTAAAGIGTISVNSIGSGVTGSLFEADFDWQLVNDVPGNVAGFDVRVPGRNASAVSGTAVGGAGIGFIDVRLANAAENGLNAIATSTFTARSGAIGTITVVLSPTARGYAILTSTFYAWTGIGAISITGNTLGAVFIVAGQPIVVRSRAVGARAVPSGIGPVSLLGGTSQDISLSSTSTVGGVSFTNALAGSTVKLVLSGTSVGNLLVDAPAGVANLDVSGAVTAIGNVSADGAVSIVSSTTTSLGAVSAGGNATLNTPALQVLASLNVGGTLSLPQDLASLRQVGAFTVNALAATSKNIRIGSSATSGSSIGPIRIATANRGKGVYQFAFATWPANPTKANPVAIIGGKSIVAPKTTAQSANGVSIVKLKK